MQIIGHHHQIELPPAQGKGRAALQIGGDLGQPRRIGLLIGIAVDSRHCQTMFQQQLAVPAAACGQIEGAAARPDQGQEAQNPGGGFLPDGQSFAIYVTVKL